MHALEFKFRWVDENGQPQAFRVKKGSLGEEELALEDTKIPVAAITEVDVRGKNVVLAILTGENESANVVFYTDQAMKLKAELGRVRGAAWAEMHRKDLEAKGLGQTFRQQICPSCQAVIDLTGKKVTPQVSCQFCHTLSAIELPADDLSANDKPAASALGYRLCDECGMYSKPRQFTIFYFYFLLVVYGWHSRTTWRCPGCMRGEAWKMLFGNLLFILGIPTAIIQLYRAYGGTDIGGPFPGLDKANLLARNGDLTGAITSYQTLLQAQPVAAGVKYNIGLALLQQKRHDQAARMFEFALDDCANYEPAASALAMCYETLGEQDKLAALKSSWGIESADEQIQAGDAQAHAIAE
jgi:tetratricopeptide (TPR) repeat protein